MFRAGQRDQERRIGEVAVWSLNEQVEAAAGLPTPPSSGPRFHGSCACQDAS
jgi:hypothetical protein